MKFFAAVIFCLTIKGLCSAPVSEENNSEKKLLKRELSNCMDRIPFTSAIDNTFSHQPYPPYYYNIDYPIETYYLPLPSTPLSSPQYYNDETYPIYETIVYPAPPPPPSSSSSSSAEASDETASASSPSSQQEEHKDRNSNSQSGISQIGWGNINSQTTVLQNAARRQNYIQHQQHQQQQQKLQQAMIKNSNDVDQKPYRRQNKNEQANVNQSGWLNINAQDAVGQISRRQNKDPASTSATTETENKNTNEQKQVQQSGWGNFNLQGALSQSLSSMAIPNIPNMPTIPTIPSAPSVPILSDFMSSTNEQ